MAADKADKATIVVTVDGAQIEAALARVANLQQVLRLAQCVQNLTLRVANLEALPGVREALLVAQDVAQDAREALRESVW